MTSSPSRTRVRHPWWTGFNRFFGLLGWAISGDDKDLAFARVFKVLGVQICLHLDRSRSGTISFQNTPKRVEELIGSISAILKAGRLLPRVALRGRMQFAKTQLYNRASKTCLNAVSRHAHGPEGPKLSEQLASSGTRGWVGTSSVLSTGCPRQHAAGLLISLLMACWCGRLGSAFVPTPALGAAIEEVVLRLLFVQMSTREMCFPD